MESRNALDELLDDDDNSVFVSPTIDDVVHPSDSTPDPEKVGPPPAGATDLLRKLMGVGYPLSAPTKKLGGVTSNGDFTRCDSTDQILLWVVLVRKAGSTKGSPPNLLGKVILKENG